MPPRPDRIRLADRPAADRVTAALSLPVARLLARLPSALVTPVGIVEFHARRVGHPAAPTPGALVLGVRVGAHLLRVEADADLGRALADSLHLPAASSGFVRGVVAAFLASLFADRDLPAALSLGKPPDLSGSDAFIEASVSIAAATGTLRVCAEPGVFVALAESLAERQPDTTSRVATHAGALATRAVIELGRTELPASDVSALAPGDVVVFSGLAFPHDPSLVVTVVVASHAVPARWYRDTDLVLCGSLQPRTRSVSDQPPPEPRSTLALADMPVEVVAELGRLTLTGAEAAGLVAGSVLSLSPASLDHIALTVDGRTIARGEIVNIEGELGVRLTETPRP